MENKICKGLVTEKEEFLYPDLTLRDLPQSISFPMAQNGKRGFQLLLKTSSLYGEVVIETEDFDVEYYQMISIPVEYNTGDGVEQGGSMVLMDYPKEKPSYCTRKAPFRVYDCLKPLKSSNDKNKVIVKVPVEKKVMALYVCLSPKKSKTTLVQGQEPRKSQAFLTVNTEDGAYNCSIDVQIYNVIIPDESLSLTNWFSLDAICYKHNVSFGSDAFYQMVRKYGKVMRRARQTHFFIQLDDRCIVSKKPWKFDFSYLNPLICLFFEEGFKVMEIGTLLSRGFLSNGRPDVYTDVFKCSMAPNIPVESEEGYEILVTSVKALSDFLRSNHWEDKVVFHVHDEPDIHVKNKETLEHRKRQYFLAANILRKYIPKVKIIEAVASPAFKGGVDIWVPGTAGYEEQKECFDYLLSLGEEVWNYVCCGPEGHYLNRFLDYAVIKSRLLLWGCASYGLTGFLHWGLNQFPNGLDPFKATSCYNNTGVGTNFPCGDSFIVYPGKDAPYISLRLEALRQGAEDYELLKLLKEKDSKVFKELVSQVFISNSEYDENPKKFEKVYEKLLKTLVKK